MEIILLFLKKHGGALLVVLTLVGMLTYMSIQNYLLQNNVKQLQSEKLVVEQLREIEKEKAINQINTLTIKYNNEAQAREKYYAEQYKNLLDDYNTSRKSVDGLYSTTEKIRNDIRDTNTSKEVIIRYVDNYEAVFKECVNEYTEVAKDADRLVLTNQSLNDEIESIYTLMEEYKSK